MECVWSVRLPIFIFIVFLLLFSLNNNKNREISIKNPILRTSFSWAGYCVIAMTLDE